MSVADDLRAARALIEDPEHWTTRAHARDASGSRTSSRGPAAVAWCAIGAVRATVPSNDCASSLFLLSDSCPSKLSISQVNDDRGHAAVLSLYDRAIAHAEAIQ